MNKTCVLTMYLADLTFCDREERWRGETRKHANSSPAQAASITPRNTRLAVDCYKTSERTEHLRPSTSPQRSLEGFTCTHEKNGTTKSSAAHTSYPPRRFSHYGGTRTKEKNGCTTSSLRASPLLLEHPFSPVKETARHHSRYEQGNFVNTKKELEIGQNSTPSAVRRSNATSDTLISTNRPSLLPNAALRPSECLKTHQPRRHSSSGTVPTCQSTNHPKQRQMSPKILSPRKTFSTLPVDDDSHSYRETCPPLQKEVITAMMSTPATSQQCSGQRLLKHEASTLFTARLRFYPDRRLPYPARLLVIVVVGRGGVRLSCFAQ